MTIRQNIVPLATVEELKNVQRLHKTKIYVRKNTFIDILLYRTCWYSIYLPQNKSVQQNRPSAYPLPPGRIGGQHRFVSIRTCGARETNEFSKFHF